MIEQDDAGVRLRAGSSIRAKCQLGNNERGRTRGAGREVQDERGRTQGRVRVVVGVGVGVALGKPA